MSVAGQSNKTLIHMISLADCWPVHDNFTWTAKITQKERKPFQPNYAKVLYQEKQFKWKAQFQILWKV